MRRFSELLKDSAVKDNAKLLALSGQAGNLTATQKIWNTIAPDNLKQYTQAGSVKHKRLTVYAENGAVAAKIKLLLPSLLTKLQKQGLEVTSIRVQVQVQSSVQRPGKNLRSLSPQAASSLSELAEKLTGTELGEALARLSSRT
jgi:hypothetical protein